MWRLLHDEFMNALPDQKHTLLPRAIDVATGTLAYPLIRMLADTLQSLHRNVKVTVHCIRNDFFGGNVSVAGLITGTDLIAQLKGKLRSHTLGIPEVMLREEKDKFPGRRYRQAAGKGVGRARAHPAAERRGAAESPAEVRKLRKPDTKERKTYGKTHRSHRGRPNVGKSTLFNKLVGQRLAIVEDTPGVTRDRLYGNCEWQDHRFCSSIPAASSQKRTTCCCVICAGRRSSPSILRTPSCCDGHPQRRHRAGSGHRGHAHAQRQACVPCGKQGRRCGRAAHGTV